MQEKELKRAKEAALRLLKYRARSRKELEDRLRRKSFSPEVISEIINWFEEQNLLNDKEFAQDWIAWRRRKGYGFFKIKKELREKGLEDELINKFLLPEKENFRQRLKELIKKRLPRLKNDSFKKRKLFSYFLRRGFSLEEIERAWQSLNYEDRPSERRIS